MSESHPLAAPPPWETYPPPLRIRRIVSCSAPRAAGLRRTAAAARTDALRITDGDGGGHARSWASLVGMSEHRVVLVSLGVLASAINRVAPGVAVLRLRRQHDKPTCARVQEANFITRGFALHDVFWYGWHDRGRGVYVQRQLVRSARLRQFCRDHGLLTVLDSEADTDAASGHPLCLYRAGRSGFLLAMDLEPPANWTSAEPVSPYADRLLRQALGQASPGWGQYVTAPRCRQEFVQTMAGLADRFAHLRWVPTGSPKSRPPLGWMELRGGAARMPTHRKAGRMPARILIRTGFSPGEWDLVFAVAMFLKELGRRGRTGAMGGPPARVLRRHNRGAPCEEMPAIRWVPLACRRAVPPPAGPKEYVYVMEVPSAGGRDGMDRSASMRIDIRRARGSSIEIRTSTRSVNGRATMKRIARLCESLGVGLRIGRCPRAPDAAEAWELALPVTRRPCEYDAVAAVDRVVELLRALLGL